MRSMKLLLSLLLVSLLFGCNEATENPAPPQSPATTQGPQATSEAGGEATVQPAEAMGELKEKQAQAAKAWEALAKFQVLEARFYKTQETYLGKRQPRMEITFKNGSEVTVARFYGIGTLTKADGSEVLLHQPFSHKFSKALAPGDVRKEDFGLNMYSPWAEVEIPEDALLTIEVVQLDGAGGKNLFPAAAAFTAEDAKKLDELKKATAPQ